MKVIVQQWASGCHLVEAKGQNFIWILFLPLEAGGRPAVSFSTPLVKPAPRMTPGSAREPWYSKIISFQEIPEETESLFPVQARVKPRDHRHHLPMWSGIHTSWPLPRFRTGLGGNIKLSCDMPFWGHMFLPFFRSFPWYSQEFRERTMIINILVLPILFNSFHSVLLSYFTFVKNLPCARYHAFTYIAWFNHHVSFVLWIWITSSYRWISDTWTSE